ncbi:MAG: UDP-N-acetylmuramoyl-tripeptide--D-alanyl-D-alanine ligase [Vicinamibacteria bacterium]|nr:UDP-N-acetylmuramoyl-tripeptide--D-alanyl-D-alanine ligase [Vicinamibacteria bacterium]
MNLTIQQAAKITAGDLIASGASTSRMLAGVSIDSRSIARDEMFVAIPGARFDGHDFLQDVARRGAAAAVVSRTTPAPAELPLVRVADTERALHDLAHHVRGMTKAAVVGITGSAGKTTTKEFAASLLANLGPILKSEKNLNNRYGVPLTLLRLRHEHVAAVVEMGMSAAGELRLLARTTRPDAAVITNVAPVHLEFFASIEAIAQAKAEILEGVRNGGWLALNHDDPLVRRIGESFSGDIVWFGSDRTCEVRVRAREETSSGITFTLALAGKESTISLGLTGRHMMMNFAAAAAVAHRLDVPLDTIVRSSSFLTPAPHRGERLLLNGDVLLIDDSYNSNPAAVVAAVESMPHQGGRRRVAFLGEMLELGPRGPELHVEAGKRIAASVDCLVAVGSLARGFLEGAERAGRQAACRRFFKDAVEASVEAPEIVRPGDMVVVKGSRGVRMERIVEALVARLGRSEV